MISECDFDHSQLKVPGDLHDAWRGACVLHSRCPTASEVLDLLLLTGLSCSETDVRRWCVKAGYPLKDGPLPFYFGGH